jgi:hypothetical protein
MLTYGPYATLMPGTYRITIDYSAYGGGHVWDLAHFDGNVHFRVPLPSTTGLRTTVSQEITLPNGDSRVEVRTYFGGEGTLTVYRIFIEPR